jgi:hypothetical protein
VAGVFAGYADAIKISPATSPLMHIKRWGGIADKKEQ